MKTVLLVSKGFNRNDGIGRISRELYNNLVSIRDGNINKLDLELYSGINPNPISQFIGKQREFKAFKFVKEFNPSIVHAQAPDHASVLAYPAPRRILTWEDTVVYDRLKESSGLLHLKYLYKAILWNEAFYNADVIIDISTITKKNREKMTGKKRRSHVVPIGVDNVFLNSKIWKGERKDFVYVGSVEYANKNIPLLFKFMSMLNEKLKPKPRLHIYTSTHDAEYYVTDLMELYNVNLVLHKNRPDKEICESLSTKVALLHFAKSEGFGLPILEAMATGLPVLTLKDADIPEEVTKYTYKGDIHKLFEIALDLSKAQEPLKEKMIDYARGFTWKKYAERIEQIYEIEG
ncbi:MAG: glycosyltransferase [Gammaproteobacteria bacterium]